MFSGFVQFCMIVLLYAKHIFTDSSSRSDLHKEVVKFHLNSNLLKILLKME